MNITGVCKNIIKGKAFLHCDKGSVGPYRSFSCYKCSVHFKLIMVIPEKFRQDIEGVEIL